MLKQWLGIAVVGSFFFAATADAAPRYKDITPKQCIRVGYRMHSGILWDIPWGYSWERACAETPATVAGRYFSRATRCINKTTNMWGEFDVPDNSCNPYWGSFKQNACVREGVRNYSAGLENIPPGVSWEATCANFPATINGYYFPKPLRCVNTTVKMWGEWEVPENSCRPYWDPVKNDGCVDIGKRQYSAILQNVLPGNSWEEACSRTPNTVAGQYFGRPTRCKNNSGINMWGEWDVDDASCQARWDTPKADHCTDAGRRQWSTVLRDIPSRTSWENACKQTFATIAGKSSKPNRCVVNGSMWGEFERDDAACNPTHDCSAGAPQPAGTFAKPNLGGAVSCTAYCANRDGNWGPRGTCVKGIVQSGRNAGQCISCNDVGQDSGDTNITCYCAPEPTGFADLHNHQFANEAFGGLAFHGKAFGPPDQALPWCSVVHGPGGTTDFISKLMGHGVLGHSVGGYPEFDGWPRWNSYAHQSVHEDWLYRAYQGGLRLMVMHAVNNQDIFNFPVNAFKAPGRTGKDMEAVDLQLNAAYAMQDYIDAKSGGAGKGWYRIVKTPAEARQVITDNKLAVVLGMEVDYPFDCEQEAQCSDQYVLSQLQKYYDRGVRHMFPIHFKANAFGGSAISNPLTNGPMRNCASEGYTYQWNPLSPPLCGSVGLTSRGRLLINEMMKRGMIIDIDHMSNLAFNDTMSMVEAKRYPVISGHTGLIEVSNKDKNHEGNLKLEQLDRIRNVGGMVSLIIAQGDVNQIREWRGPGQPVVAHKCGNTSQTFAQSYLNAVYRMRGGPIAIGTDFNGMAGMPGPRMADPDACPGTPFDPINKAIIVGQQVNDVKYPLSISVKGSPAKLNRSYSGNVRNFDINVDGVAHMGMLPDFIEDLRRQGLRAVDLDPLMRSAIGYVDVWDRAYANVPQPPTPCGVLGSGQSLLRGEKRTACNGQAELVHQTDGNVVIYRKGVAVWSTNTFGRPSQRFIMQIDGNLVLYDTAGQVLWQSGTPGQVGATFKVKDDCNGVILTSNNVQVWATGYLCTPRGCGTMISGDSLTGGQSVTSCDGAVKFTLGTDGNLVMTRGANTYFRSNTAGTPGARLLMQGDGNLVLYSTDNRALWSTGTWGRRNAYFSLQNSCNAVMLSETNATLWSTNTLCEEPLPPPPPIFKP